MTTVTLEEAQAKLADLVHGLAPGEELLITENDRPIARLTATDKVTGADVCKERDWWSALQTIEAGQRQRGFVGAVCSIDRNDEGYDERMKDVYGKTTPRTGKA